MSENKLPFWVKILIVLLPAALGGILTYNILSNMLLRPVNPKSTEIVRIEVPQGSTLSQIASDLESKEVIRSARGLKIIAKLKVKDGTIKAGEYELISSMTPYDVLKKLISGDIVRRKVLVKEGATLVDIATLVEQAGIVSKNDFLSAATDKGFLLKAGLTASTFEGYLFPETYFFSKPITPYDVLWTMFEEAEKHWPSSYSDQADTLGMTRHDILTLASIIEKESGNFDEMPLVSSVFHNRLKNGMKLQSDPTIIYGLKNFNGNITKADIENPHPYNTYVHFGLPPGPIANPSESAIRSALFPQQTKFLYFVADGTGKHIFSDNLNDHNKAVATYQLGR